jgi:hypothetical protein
MSVGLGISGNPLRKIRQSPMSGGGTWPEFQYADPEQVYQKNHIHYEMIGPYSVSVRVDAPVHSKLFTTYSQTGKSLEDEIPALNKKAQPCS